MRVVYHNGVVYTGSGFAEAFAVEDGVFSFVGTNAQARELSADSFVDLRGRFVCAGFNDSHMHLLHYGQALSMAPLACHTGSIAELVECLQQYAQEHPNGLGGWLIGHGWNQDFFADAKRMPNRYDLDRVSLSKPVCAVRACGHVLSVNSKALELLGVSASSPQPEGGKIVMENGEPNGVFCDNAIRAVYAAMPLPTKDEVKDMLRAGCKKLNSFGVTSCQSDDYIVFRALPWQTVNEAFRELADAGELTVRVYEQANFTNLSALREFAEAGNTTGAGDAYFRIGPLKMLGDGSLGPRTAYLSRPYADAPETCGIPVFAQETFDELIGYANRHGMQAAIHAIGDGCLDRVLASFEKALAECPRSDHRHGIVHCQITRKDQLEKIAQLGLHIYAQTIFLDYDIHIVEQRVGKMLADTSYRWKTLMNRGVHVSNGSDCPVEEPNVMRGMQCAVTRKTICGDTDAYHKDEAFSVEEAIKSYTVEGAYASFEEAAKGAIETGMLADFVVLDADPFKAKEIGKISVAATVSGGKPVFGELT